MQCQRRRQLVSIGAAALLCLTACGSEGESADGPRPDGTPIKVGLAFAQTGFSSAVIVPALGVAQAWADWVNAEGGIDGHPVDLVVRDTAATPATGLSAIRDLVENEGVSAIMVADAVTETAAADYLADQDIAVLQTQSYDPTTWSAQPQFMTTSVTDKYMLSGYAVAADAAGATTLGMAACAEIAACAQAGDVNAELASAFGIDYSSTVLISASQPSFTAECLNFVDSGTDDIAVALDFATTGVRVVGDCLQQGYDGVFGVGSGSVIGSLFDTLPGAKFVGAMNGFPWWVDAPPVQEYRDVMAEYGEDTDIEGTWQTSTWASLQMFHKALTGNITEGEVTPDQVLAAYATVTDETLDGLLASPMSYPADQPAPVIPCYWIYSHTGGSDDYELIQEGDSGNGVDTDLASSCYDGPDF